MQKNVRRQVVQCSLILWCHKGSNLYIDPPTQTAQTSTVPDLLFTHIIDISNIRRGGVGNEAFQQLICILTFRHQNLVFNIITQRDIARQAVVFNVL